MGRLPNEKSSLSTGPSPPAKGGGNMGRLPNEKPSLSTGEGWVGVGVKVVVEVLASNAGYAVSIKGNHALDRHSPRRGRRRRSPTSARRACPDRP